MSAIPTLEQLYPQVPTVLMVEYTAGALVERTNRVVGDFPT